MFVQIDQHLIRTYLNARTLITKNSSFNRVASEIIRFTTRFIPGNFKKPKAIHLQQRLGNLQVTSEMKRKIITAILAQLRS